MKFRQRLKLILQLIVLTAIMGLFNNCSSGFESVGYNIAGKTELSSETPEPKQPQPEPPASTPLQSRAPASTAPYLPVIPGRAGFGMETKAGRGGQIYRVTNLNDTGAGSLRACVDASGPRVCVFEISGEIRLTKNLTIRNPFITIAGQTAPRPGIMLRGAALLVGTSEVLVQHLRVRVGDHPSTETDNADNRDALRIEAPAVSPLKNVVIDHCSFSWSIDEMASVYLGADNVTLIHNIFAEPLNDSIHSKGAHGFGVLVGSVDNGVNRVSIIGNILAHQLERNPLSRGGNFVFANNVIYDAANYDAQVGSEGPIPTNNAFVSNVHIRGPSKVRNYKPIILRGGEASGTSWPLAKGSKVFVADIDAVEAMIDEWAVVDVQSPNVKSDFFVSTPPVWPAGLNVHETRGNKALDYILAEAGAFPAARDAVDSRVVKQIKDGTGQIINCVSPDGTARCSKNAGGWPVYSVNRRTLALPANPEGDSDGDGYTNLEEFLHEYARLAEGL